MMRIVLTASFIFNIIYFAAVFGQTAPNCNPPGVEEEALIRVQLDQWNSKIQPQIEKLQNAQALREKYKSFLKAEFVEINKKKKSKEISDVSALKMQFSLFHWYRENSEKSSSMKLAPLMISEIDEITGGGASKDHDSFVKELLRRNLAQESVELKAQAEEIRDEDIIGVGKWGMNRVMGLDAALKDRDLAVKTTALRFREGHPGNFVVVELAADQLGTDSATQRKGYKIRLTSSEDIKIDELIEVNRKPDMMFAQMIVRRPRTLLFISPEIAGLSISPAAKLQILRVETEIK